ncbi:uncharacterized protein B0H18DRAFT_675087 [Fomitopsis serialis]|uniref:uncharacterized protein n=1 Tax=Fomitopsis serialis TaxID=139415 RepID=UPI002008B8BE|nr:uncharacterized protein B0H18DRAFT_675087 [Neoantrodia serialis]KAH9933041.1 hypothetical protein B0H18DRAFT_675087 [Neoantrodia serialis]
MTQAAATVPILVHYVWLIDLVRREREDAGEIDVIDRLGIVAVSKLTDVCTAADALCYFCDVVDADTGRYYGRPLLYRRWQSEHSGYLSSPSCEGFHHFSIPRHPRAPTLQGFIVVLTLQVDRSVFSNSNVLRLHIK